MVYPRNISLTVQCWSCGVSSEASIRGRRVVTPERVEISHRSRINLPAHFFPVVSDLIKVVKEIGKQFHSQRMDVILVIPPQKGEE